jgi:CheY-like chemotaxis protein
LISIPRRTDRNHHFEVHYTPAFPLTADQKRGILLLQLHNYASVQMGNAMARQPESLTLFSTRYAAVGCPAQVLVIDRVDGPAHVLVDTISRLSDCEVSVTLVDDLSDALRATACCGFDLVVVGLEDKRPVQLTVLPHLRIQNPDLPLAVIGRNLSHFDRQYARQHGVSEVLDVPERAADLKVMIADLSERYLSL